MGLAQCAAPCYIDHVRNTTHSHERHTKMINTTHTTYCASCDAEIEYNVRASRECDGLHIEIEFERASCAHETWDDDAHVARVHDELIFA